MRKEKVIYVGLALLIAVMLFLDGSFSFTDRTTSAVYNLSDLKLTQIDIQCEVFIARGDNKKLVIEGPQEILDNLDIDQNNGILSIRNKKSSSIFNFMGNALDVSGKVKIYINHSELDRIIVHNDAKIISVDYKQAQFHANSFEDEEEEQLSFKIVDFNLGNIKQRIVKSLVEKTIFRIYSTV